MKLFGENLVFKIWIFIEVEIYAVSRFYVFEFLNLQFV